MLQRYSLSFGLLLCCGLLCAQTPVTPAGYIVTKDDHHLTGSIGTIEHNSGGSLVEFINDFGTPYVLHPALIKGFVFFEGPVVNAYESKFYQSKWMYLRLIYAGNNISLLQTPENFIKYEWEGGQIIARERRIQQYWVELPGDRIVPLQRLGFRRQMRKLCGDAAPQLADKIGQPGYRFKNLYSILSEYDQESAKGKRRL